MLFLYLIGLLVGSHAEHIPVSWGAGVSSPIIVHYEDTVEFSWAGAHTLVQLVSAGAYGACDFTGAASLGTTSPFNWTAPASAGTLYFSSDKGSDCVNGVKTTVIVCAPHHSGASCAADPCPALAALPAHSTPGGSGSAADCAHPVPVGATCDVACDAGFVRNGSTALSCVAAGQALSGVQTCVDVNECANGDNGGCDRLTACVNTVGSFTCGACPTGYTGTSLTGCMPPVCALARDTLPENGHWGSCTDPWLAAGEWCSIGCETSFLLVGDSRMCMVSTGGQPALQGWEQACFMTPVTTLTVQAGMRPPNMMGPPGGMAPAVLVVERAHVDAYAVPVHVSATLADFRSRQGVWLFDVSTMVGLSLNQLVVLDSVAYSPEVTLVVVGVFPRFFPAPMVNAATVLANSAKTLRQTMQPFLTALAQADSASSPLDGLWTIGVGVLGAQTPNVTVMRNVTIKGCQRGGFIRYPTDPCPVPTAGGGLGLPVGIGPPLPPRTEVPIMVGVTVACFVLAALLMLYLYKAHRDHRLRFCAWPCNQQEMRLVEDLDPHHLHMGSPPGASSASSISPTKLLSDAQPMVVVLTPIKEEGGYAKGKDFAGSRTSAAAIFAESLKPSTVQAFQTPEQPTKKLFASSPSSAVPRPSPTGASHGGHGHTHGSGAPKFDQHNELKFVAVASYSASSAFHGSSGAGSTGGGTDEAFHGSSSQSGSAPATPKKGHPLSLSPRTPSTPPSAPTTEPNTPLTDSPFLLSPRRRSLHVDINAERMSDHSIIGRNESTHASEDELDDTASVGSLEVSITKIKKGSVISHTSRVSQASRSTSRVHSHTNSRESLDVVTDITGGQYSTEYSKNSNASLSGAWKGLASLSERDEHSKNSQHSQHSQHSNEATQRSRTSSSIETRPASSSVSVSLSKKSPSKQLRATSVKHSAKKGRSDSASPPPHTLTGLFRSHSGMRAFAMFLTRELSLEQLRFWEDVEKYRLAKFVHLQKQAPVKDTLAKLEPLGHSIWSHYIAADAVNPLPLPDAVRQRVRSNMNKLQAGDIHADGPAPPSGEGKDIDDDHYPTPGCRTLFDEAHYVVFEMLKNDAFARFLTSAEYKAAFGLMHQSSTDSL